MQLSSLIGGHVEKIDVATPLVDASQWMTSRSVGSLLVTANGKVQGILTEHDLTRAVAHEVDMQSALTGDWMSKYPQVATPEWDLDSAADVMLEHGFRHLPVIDVDGEPIGMVSIKDVVWAMRGIPGD